MHTHKTHIHTQLLNQKAGLHDILQLHLSYQYSHNCLQFVAAGGLQQLLEIFNSGILEPKEQESWTVVSGSSLL